MSAESVPVTVISGFLGAGKTSMIEHLKHLLRSRNPVFITDNGEGDLIAELNEAATRESGSSGSGSGSSTGVIILECAASLEPYFIAEHTLEGDEFTPPPEEIRIDTMVTVVDASRFTKDIMSEKSLLEAGLALDEFDDRCVADVILEQVEFADILVINKTDLATPAELDELEALLQRLNPHAKQIQALRGRVDASEVVDTGLFDFDETDDGAGWLCELHGDFEELDQSQGASSFTYVDRRPFHPARFHELLSKLPLKGVVRAKGSIWVASRHHEIGVWSLAGPRSELMSGGAWFASTPARDWPHDEIERAEIMNEWVPPFGDRRQEIAFIGLHMNETEIRERLDACLLTDAEMKDGPDSWDPIPDPLPDWTLE